MIRLLLAFLFVILPASSAYANVPIGGLAFIAYPALALTSEPLFSLLAVIAIESAILILITRINVLKALLAVSFANVFSTLIGVLIAISGSMFVLYLIALFPFAMMFGGMIRKISDSTGVLPRFSDYSTVCVFLLQASVLVPGVYLIPLTSGHSPPGITEPSQALVLLSVISILIVGFVLSLISEAYVLLKLSRKIGLEAAIAKPVLFMNLASYLTLIVLFGQRAMEQMFS